MAGSINPGWSLAITWGRISTWCRAHILAIIFFVLDSAVKLSLLFFSDGKNLIACVNIQGKLFLSTLALTLFKVACLQGRLVQGSGKSQWKFRSWCFLANKQLLVLTELNPCARRLCFCPTESRRDTSTWLAPGQRHSKRQDSNLQSPRWWSRLSRLFHSLLKVPGRDFKSIYWTKFEFFRLSSQN